MKSLDSYLYQTCVLPNMSNIFNIEFLCHYQTGVLPNMSNILILIFLYHQYINSFSRVFLCMSCVMKNLIRVFFSCSN